MQAVEPENESVSMTGVMTLKEKVESLQSFSGASAEECRSFLEGEGGNFDRASLKLYAARHKEAQEQSKRQRDEERRAARAVAMPRLKRQLSLALGRTLFWVSFREGVVDTLKGVRRPQHIAAVESSVPSPLQHFWHLRASLGSQNMSGRSIRACRHPHFTDKFSFLVTHDDAEVDEAEAIGQAGSSTIHIELCVQDGRVIATASLPLSPLELSDRDTWVPLYTSSTSTDIGGDTATAGACARSQCGKLRATVARSSIEQALRDGVVSQGASGRGRRRALQRQTSVRAGRKIAELLMPAFDPAVAPPLPPPPPSLTRENSAGALRRNLLRENVERDMGASSSHCDEAGRGRVSSELGRVPRLVRQYTAPGAIGSGNLADHTHMQVVRGQETPVPTAAGAAGSPDAVDRPPLRRQTSVGTRALNKAAYSLSESLARLIRFMEEGVKACDEDVHVTPHLASALTEGRVEVKLLAVIRDDEKMDHEVHYIACFSAATAREWVQYMVPPASSKLATECTSSAVENEVLKEARTNARAVHTQAVRECLDEAKLSLDVIEKQDESKHDVGERYCITCLRRATAKFVAASSPQVSESTSLSPCTCHHVKRALSECSVMLGASELQQLLTPDEFQLYLGATLQQLIESDDNLCRCPNPECAVPIEVADASAGAADAEEFTDIINANCETATHAQAMAKAHYNRWRLRCQSCNTVFCGRCLTIGYHEGYDCEGWRRKAEQRKCVFCGQGLAPPTEVNIARQQVQHEDGVVDNTVSDVGGRSGDGAELANTEPSTVTTKSESVEGAARAPAVYEEDLYALQLDGCRTFAEIGTLVDLDESHEKVSENVEDQEAKPQDDYCTNEDDEESDVQMFEGEPQALTEDDDEETNGMITASRDGMITASRVRNLADLPTKALTAEAWIRPDRRHLRGEMSTGIIIALGADSYGDTPGFELALRDGKLVATVARLRQPDDHLQPDALGYWPLDHGGESAGESLTQHAKPGRPHSDLWSCPGRWVCAESDFCKAHGLLQQQTPDRVSAGGCAGMYPEVAEKLSFVSRRSAPQCAELKLHDHADQGAETAPPANVALDQDPWQCEVCTLINEGFASNCSVCGTVKPRSKAHVEPEAAATPPEVGLGQDDHYRDAKSAVLSPRRAVAFDAGAAQSLHIPVDRYFSKRFQKQGTLSLWVCWRGTQRQLRVHGGTVKRISEEHAPLFVRRRLFDFATESQLQWSIALCKHTLSSLAQDLPRTLSTEAELLRLARHRTKREKLYFASQLSDLATQKENDTEEEHVREIVKKAVEHCIAAHHCTTDGLDGSCKTSAAQRHTKARMARALRRRLRSARRLLRLGLYRAESESDDAASFDRIFGPVLGHEGLQRKMNMKADAATPGPLNNVLALTDANPDNARLIYRHSHRAPLLCGRRIVGDGRWHHIAIRWGGDHGRVHEHSDSKRRVELWLDGELEASASADTPLSFDGSLCLDGRAMQYKPQLRAAVGKEPAECQNFAQLDDTNNHPITVGSCGPWGHATASVAELALWERPLKRSQLYDLASRLRLPMEIQRRNVVSESANMELPVANESKWIHVGMSWDGKLGEIRVFANGEEAHKNVAKLKGDLLDRTWQSLAHIPLRIGHSAAEAAARRSVYASEAVSAAEHAGTAYSYGLFCGVMSEVRLWRVARTPWQIERDRHVRLMWCGNHVESQTDSAAGDDHPETVVDANGLVGCWSLSQKSDMMGRMRRAADETRTSRAQRAPSADNESIRDVGNVAALIAQMYVPQHSDAPVSLRERNAYILGGRERTAYAVGATLLEHGDAHITDVQGGSISPDLRRFRVTTEEVSVWRMANARGEGIKEIAKLPLGATFDVVERIAPSNDENHGDDGAIFLRLSAESMRQQLEYWIADTPYGGDIRHGWVRIGRDEQDCIVEIDISTGDSKDHETTKKYESARLTEKETKDNVDSTKEETKGVWMPDSGSWTCTVCTFLNKISFALSCEMCQTPRFSGTANVKANVSKTGGAIFASRGASFEANKASKTSSAESVRPQPSQCAKWDGIAATLDRKKLFCAPDCSSSILVIDLEHKCVRTISCGHLLPGPMRRAWSGIVAAADGNKLFCAPDCAPCVLVIDAETESVRAVALPRTCDAKQENKWCGIAAGLGGAKVFCAPMQASGVLMIDANSEESREITSMGLGLHEQLWSGITATADERKLFCTPFCASSILVVDADRETLSKIAIDHPGNVKQAWVDGVEAHGKIFCAPSSSSHVLVIDIDPDSDSDTYHMIDLHDVPNVGTVDGRYKWSSVTTSLDGDKVFCAPSHASAILAIDAKTESVHGIACPTARAWRWSGFTAACDGMLYAAPSNAQGFLVLDPDTGAMQTVRLYTNGWTEPYLDRRRPSAINPPRPPYPQDVSGIWSLRAASSLRRLDRSDKSNIFYVQPISLPLAIGMRGRVVGVPHLRRIWALIGGEGEKTHLQGALEGVYNTQTGTCTLRQSLPWTCGFHGEFSPDSSELARTPQISGFMCKGGRLHFCFGDNSFACATADGTGIMPQIFVKGGFAECYGYVSDIPVLCRYEFVQISPKALLPLLAADIKQGKFKVKDHHLNINPLLRSESGSVGVDTDPLPLVPMHRTLSIAQGGTTHKAQSLFTALAAAALPQDTSLRAKRFPYWRPALAARVGALLAAEVKLHGECTGEPRILSLIASRPERAPQFFALALERVHYGGLGLRLNPQNSNVQHHSWYASESEALATIAQLAREPQTTAVHFAAMSSWRSSWHANPMLRRQSGSAIDWTAAVKRAQSAAMTTLNSTAHLLWWLAPQPKDDADEADDLETGWLPLRVDDTADAVRELRRIGRARMEQEHVQRLEGERRDRAEKKRQLKERKEKASTLQAMGYPHDVAMDSLEKHENDLERAADWLMGDEGQAEMIRRQQHLHAVDAAAADDGNSVENDRGAWVCEVCTFLNENPLALCCEMCQTQKPVTENNVGTGDVAADQQVASDDDDAESEVPMPDFPAAVSHRPNGQRAKRVKAVDDVCTSIECLERRAHASFYSHPECGHRSGGCRGDCVVDNNVVLRAAKRNILSDDPDDSDECKLNLDTGASVLRCLHCSGEADELCTICFVEGLDAAPVIELESCNHLFHEHCLRAQLAQGLGKKASIDFSALKCPTCKKIMQHRQLEPLMKKMKDALFEVQRQAQIKAERDSVRDDEDIAAKVENEFSGDWNRYLLEAYYDFRMCGKCKKPFIAGLRECGAAGEDAEGDADLDAIRCDVCQNNAKADCPKHGKEFIAWKCRYCCGNCGDPKCTGMAVYSCFGYLHACKHCHDYERLQQLMDFSKSEPYPNKIDDVAGYDPHPCSGLKCDPATCPWGGRHPPNGEEWCLGCTMCMEEAGVTSHGQAAPHDMVDDGLEPKLRAVSTALKCFFEGVQPQQVMGLDLDALKLRRDIDADVGADEGKDDAEIGDEGAEEVKAGDEADEGDFNAVANVGAEGGKDGEELGEEGAEEDKEGEDAGEGGVEIDAAKDNGGHAAQEGEEDVRDDQTEAIAITAKGGNDILQATCLDDACDRLRSAFVSFHLQCTPQGDNLSKIAEILREGFGQQKHPFKPELLRFVQVACTPEWLRAHDLPAGDGRGTLELLDAQLKEADPPVTRAAITREYKSALADARDPVATFVGRWHLYDLKINGKPANSECDYLIDREGDNVIGHGKLKDNPDWQLRIEGKAQPGKLEWKEFDVTPPGNLLAEFEFHIMPGLLWEGTGVRQDGKKFSLKARKV